MEGVTDDSIKSSTQLIQELQEARRQIAELKAASRDRSPHKASASFMEDVLEHTHMMVVLLDAKFNFVWVNAAYAATCGHEASFFTGKNHFDLYPHAENEAIFQRVVDTGEPFYIEAKSFEFPDQPERGATYWDWSLFPVKDGNGHVSNLVFTPAEVTQRVTTEEALRESERKLSNAMSMARLGHWELDVASGIFTFSDSFFDIFHTSAREMGGYRLSMEEYAAHFIHPEDAPLLAKETQDALEADDPNYTRYLEHRMRYADGSIGYIAVRFFIVKDSQGKTIRTYGVNQDITESRQAEQKLSESEEKYRQLMQHLPVGVVVHGPDTAVLLANEEACNRLGLSLQQMQGKVAIDPAWAFLREDGSPMPPEEYPVCRVIKLNRPVTGMVIGIQRLPDGDRVWVLVNAFPASGQRGEIVVTFSDITERKRTEVALKASERRYRTFIDETTEGIYRLDLDVPMPVDLGVEEQVDYIYAHACIGECNLGFVKMYGCVSPQDLNGKKLVELHGGPNQPKNRAEVRKFVVSNYRVEHEETEEIGSDGSTCILANNTVGVVENGLLTHMWGTQVDITERKRLEEQLRQAQKMEAVGQLAGGVAHDFNNILQVILANAESLRDEYAPSSSHGTAVDEILSAGQRAADLTCQLLAFGRRQLIKPVRIDLNLLIENALKMLCRVIGEHICLNFAPGRIDTVFVDKGQMEQVLMNLCVNARDAMAQGGQLTIETGNTAVDADYCRDHPWASEGHYACITVSDTGHGMSSETIEHIFEPFFTTKGMGKGTGLGLATVYGLVKHHNGLIDVQSVPGSGTTFKIYLPTVESPAEQVDGSVEASAAGGKETILVAEDEPAVLRLVARILSQAGYTVLTASNGLDALTMYEEHKADVDLVILDVMMPGLGGRQVMDHILSEHAGVRFLFSSGYSNDAIHTDFVVDQSLRLVQKPYRRDELLRMVRDILDAKRQ